MIRPATIEDGKAVFEMMKSYYRENIEKSGYDFFTWDDEKAAIYLGNLLWSDKGLNFITENNEGCILGITGETWFGHNLMGKPSAIYVKPEHRNGLIARALFRRFEREAKARGAVMIMWEFEIGLTDNRIVSGLMEKLGYKYQGPIHIKVFGGNESCLSSSHLSR